MSEPNGTSPTPSPGTLPALLDHWVAKLEVTSVLERVVGRATPPACAGLVTQGKAVVSVVDPDASGERFRVIYGFKADVRVAGNDDAILPKCDLVLVHGGAPSDWQSALGSLAKHATKALIVVVENPAAWPARAQAFLDRVRGPRAGKSRESARNEVAARTGWGQTGELAPVLWEIGRVREHAFLDVPALGLRSPGFAPRLALRHAFVVDVTPRSPQARRRLRLGA